MADVESLNRRLRQAGIMLTLSSNAMDSLLRIVEIERLIDNFESEPYFSVEWEKDGEQVYHDDNPFWNRERAEKRASEIDGAIVVEKETLPPRRFIRDNITEVDELYSDNLIRGRSIMPTALGKGVVSIFNRLGKENISDDTISRELSEALVAAEAQAAIGNCPLCASDLVLRQGKFGKFIGCEGYPDCALTFAVPARAEVVPTKDKCAGCGYPIIQIVERGKGGRNACINPECRGVVCDKCGMEMILRESDYGKFYGCLGYPECKHTKKYQ